MKTIIVAAAVLLLAACATKQATQGQEVAEEKTYRVGSHLPVKDRTDGSSSVTVFAPPPAGTPSVYIPGKGGGN
jgi:hypothetical protein